MKADFERGLYGGRNRSGGWGRRGRLDGLALNPRIVVLRLPALVAETGVRRQLRAAGAVLRHDFSVTYAAIAETTDTLPVSH